MLNLTILEIDGRPDASGIATAKVTFTSGNSTIPQTAFGAWDDVKDLEPGTTYPISFGTALPQGAEPQVTADAAQPAQPAQPQGTDDADGE